MSWKTVAQKARQLSRSPIRHVWHHSSTRDMAAVPSWVIWCVHVRHDLFICDMTHHDLDMKVFVACHCVTHVTSKEGVMSHYECTTQCIDSLVQMKVMGEKSVTVPKEWVTFAMRLHHITQMHRFYRNKSKSWEKSVTVPKEWVTSPLPPAVISHIMHQFTEQVKMCKWEICHRPQWLSHVPPANTTRQTSCTNVLVQVKMLS